MNAKKLVLVLVILTMMACGLFPVRMTFDVGPTETPIPTATPVPTQTLSPTQTPFVITATPPPTNTPTLTPTGDFLHLNCSDFQTIDFLADNYHAMAMKGNRLWKLAKEGLSHFNYNARGVLVKVDKPGLKDLEDKIDQIRDDVEGQYAPPGLAQFHSYEVWYLKSLLTAFYWGRKGDLSEANAYRQKAASYAYDVNGSYASDVCGYKVRVP